MKRRFLFSVGVLTGAGLATLVSQTDILPSAVAASSGTFRQLSLFGDVFEKVRTGYVEPPNQAKLIEGAISGMLASLDPHSGYMSSKELREMQTETHGEFGGLGIEVTMEEGLIKVIAPIDDTPAARAGILANDIIIQVSGEPVQGLTLNQAVDKMRGPVNSSVKLTIQCTDKKEPVEVKLTRETGSPALCVDHAARRTRRRSRSKLARPYICRLISLSRVICPSAWPLLQGVVSAAWIAAPSCSSPAANVSRARTPDLRASASQVSNATRAASRSTCGLTPHPRTRAVNRRASPATCAAGGSCSTRATRAASDIDSADGGWTSSQASCDGDGNAGAPSCAADIGVWAGVLVRHWGGVRWAGAVRCSATQRCTCFAVPGKPAARNSRQRASAFSQPSASRACKWARYGSRMLRRSGRPSGTGKLSAAAYLRTVPTARFIARLIASSASPAACRRLTSS